MQQPAGGEFSNHLPTSRVGGLVGGWVGNTTEHKSGQNVTFQWPNFLVAQFLLTLAPSPHSNLFVSFFLTKYQCKGF